MADAPVLIAGLGLMGGSLAAALSAAGQPVLIHARRPETMAAAVERGWGQAAPDLAAAAAQASIVVIAAPVSAIPALATTAGAVGSAIITDVGSTKATIQQTLADLHAAGRYIGSHPMCGSHLTGMDHADAQLFDGARVVVTPSAASPPEAIARLRSLWQVVGADVITMDAQAHDHAVANGSHLPHVLAAAAAALLDDQGLAVAATGFRDTTRVAAADAGLWADILLDNSAAVSDQLIEASTLLDALRQALAAGDRAAVEQWLHAARSKRQRFDQRNAADSFSS